MANMTWIGEGSNRRCKVMYECRTMDGRRKRRSKTFAPSASMKEIKFFMRSVEEDYENDYIGMNYEKCTLKRFAEDVYFPTYSQILAPTTLRNYRQMATAKNHGFLTVLGNIELEKLTSMHVQKYSNMLQKKGLNPKTIKNYVLCLHAIYDKALKIHYVKERVNIVSDVITPKIHKHKVQAYSEEELRTLLRLAEQYAKPLLKLEIYLAIGSGCRRSEMAAIQIEDIDFGNKTLSINKSKTYIGSKGDFVGPTKTEAGNREIPLPDAVCVELKKAVARYNQNRLKQGKEFNDSRYIFSDDKGNPYRTASLSNWFTRFLKKHTDEIRYLPLHTAGRHSYASLAVAQGTDIKAVQEILGHADISTTLNTYANSYEKSKKQQAEKLNENVFKSFKVNVV